MSELRLWVHHQIARLDGTRERRFVALASALIFATLAIGPQALHVVDAAVNAPDIRIDDLGTAPVPNPVHFRATVLNAVVGQLQFLVVASDGSVTPFPGHLVDPADPSIWESGDFNGLPGAAYTVKARALSSTAAGSVVESSQPITFTIFDPNSQGSSGTSGSGSGQQTPKTSELLQAIGWPGTEPKIEARGRAAGFVADSGFFRVQAITGLAFLGNYDAERAADDSWHALFAVPGGVLYRVTFIAREAGTEYASLPLEVSVPVADLPADTSGSGSGSQTPPPPPPPSVAMLLPSDGAELTSPVPLAARVSNATATGLIFEVLDPAGVTRTVPAVTGGAEWTAMFTGGAGQYRVGARTFLPGNIVIAPADFRAFRILATATSTESAPTEPPPPPPQTPVVDLVSPPAGADPFPASVPLSARVLNAVPEKAVAVVIAPDGRETIVLASKSAAGDYWTALFEGPDGEYRFRMRASIAGTDVLSTERRFTIKRPAAAPEQQLPPPPPTSTSAATTTAPPPAPTGTAPTGQLPPPPPLLTSAAEPRPQPASTTATPPSAPAPSADIPEELAAECRAAGILPARCMDWLKAKHQSRECLEAGAVTREACAALLQRLNVPSDGAKLFGLAGQADIARAREDAKKIAGESVRRDALPPSIIALLPRGEDPASRVRMVPVAGTKDDASPAILVIDTDGDDLPDDVERRFGSDPRAADTDGDGFSDGQEVRNGYDPTGPGALKAPVRGVEKALLEDLPLEEPRGADAPIDPSFTIGADETVTESATDVIRLSGTAAPNSVVAIFVYSYLPIVVTTTTDANGNWTYDFGSKLAEGRHEAYVSVNDDTGKLVAASSPLAFFVKEAQAVSEQDFLRPDVNVEEAPATFSRWFIFGGVGLVLVALILVVAIVRQTRKEPDLGPDAGV